MVFAYDQNQDTIRQWEIEPLSGAIELIREWVQQVIEAIGYTGIFLFMVVENLFPPIPSEVVMPFAGFLVAEEKLSFFGTILAGTLGSLTGTFVFYVLGKKLGRDRLKQWTLRYGKYLLLKETDLDQALEFFEKHGKTAVLFGRLLPGIRSLISIPAGINQMPLPTFLLFTFLGSTIWNVTLTYTGILLHRNWQRVLGLLDTYQALLWLITGLLILYYVKRRFRPETPAQTR